MTYKRQEWTGKEEIEKSLLQKEKENVLLQGKQGLELVTRRMLEATKTGYWTQKVT